MPFTPFHMGPGLLIKAILQGSFSLMVFGWSQIVMDIQPLWVMLGDEGGHIHGFSHTFLGASLLTIFSAFTGKYLSEFGLRVLEIATSESPIKISWWVSFLSAFVGCFSHVMLDAIMHSDVQPYFPWTLDNEWLGLMNVEQLHNFCLYTGLVGVVIYVGVLGGRMYLKKS